MRTIRSSFASRICDSRSERSVWSRKNCERTSRGGLGSSDRLRNFATSCSSTPAPMVEPPSPSPVRSSASIAIQSPVLRWTARIVALDPGVAADNLRSRASLPRSLPGHEDEGLPRRFVRRQLQVETSVAASNDRRGDANLRVAVDPRRERESLPRPASPDRRAIERCKFLLEDARPVHGALEADHRADGHVGLGNLPVDVHDGRLVDQPAPPASAMPTIILRLTGFTAGCLKGRAAATAGKVLVASGASAQPDDLEDEPVVSATPGAICAAAGGTRAGLPL